MYGLVLALLTSLSLPATAQGNAQTRQGFWITFGVGAGSLGCDDCNDEGRVGRQINPNAQELPNGIDDNCDGEIDNLIGTWRTPR